MKRRTILSLIAAASLAPGLAVTAAPAAADAGYRLSGPYVHNNLAVYLIHRKAGAKRPAPLTLQEALAAGTVRLRETGRVNRLEIENVGDKPVFIQAGDIVKGGKQDRVVTASLILPPRSGAVPLGAFCVEKGRWSKRSGEAVHRFSSSTTRMPSKEGKLALYAEPKAITRPGHRQQLAARDNQHKVWSTVDKLQKKLSRNVGTQVQSERSRTSLQLALENKNLQAAVSRYQTALAGLVNKHPDAVGYVFAVNGKINSGDEYGGNALFAKLWPKLLRASATEALAERSRSTSASTIEQPKPEAVRVFLEEPRSAPARTRRVTKDVRIKTQQTGKALYAESTLTTGAWFHRSYLAK